MKIQSLPEYNWMENCQLGDNHQSWGEKGNFSNVSRVSSKVQKNSRGVKQSFPVTEAERQTITNHELMIWKNGEMSDKTSCGTEHTDTGLSLSQIRLARFGKISQ